MNKRIIVLESYWSTRDDFIIKLEEQLAGKCNVIQTGAVDIMTDLIVMLDWEKKKNQNKIQRLARELYSAWEECDDKSLNKACARIDSYKNADTLYIMGAVIGNVPRAKLEARYPNQVVYFTTDFTGDSSIETEITRLINIEQLRLKKYTNND